jgi:UPF0755 protein
MKYTNQASKKRWPKRVMIVLVAGLLLIAGATVAVRLAYYENLKPLSANAQPRLITVKEGASVKTIADTLQQEKIIRSSWALRLYVSSKEVGSELKAGSYDLAASQSVAEIIAQLTHGKVATNLVTILPGQRLDQIHKRLVQDGFSEADVKDALNPANYANNPALVDKPAAASLEGYLYPESYQKTNATTAKTIVTASLEQMNKRLTPELRSAFAKQGLSPYQAITLASIIEKEVPKQQDREQVAQTFLLRLRSGMKLQSDVTVYYGAFVSGKAPDLTLDSPYNTYNYAGLPPTPISNVTISSLNAVASPSNTQWLYFVAGDDGTTHYAKTLAEHQANVQQYCKKLCAQ